MSSIDITVIQEALREEGIEAWLFYNNPHNRNPFTERVLGVPQKVVQTRPWYYLIPADGTPKKLVSGIEEKNFDFLPGDKNVYITRDPLQTGLHSILSGISTVAMEYSPECGIPLVSVVDAGTIELVKQQGVYVVSSADLLQILDARWSEDQVKSAFSTSVFTSGSMENAGLKKIGPSVARMPPVY